LRSRFPDFLSRIFRHGFVLHLRFFEIESSNRARASLARNRRKKATGAFASVATMSVNFRFGYRRLQLSGGALVCDSARSFKLVFIAGAPPVRELMKISARARRKSTAGLGAILFSGKSFGRWAKTTI
jgi:hypothetical protein